VNEGDGPQPTGREPSVITLTGAVFPWAGTEPVFLKLPGSPDLYLPCFSSAEKLREVLEAGNITWETIKQIQDEATFLASIYERPNVKVILDLHRTHEGTVRFTEVQRLLH